MSDYNNSTQWFTTVDQASLCELPLPESVQQLIVMENNEICLIRCSFTHRWNVKIRLAPTLVASIVDGWSTFVEQNNIQLRDFLIFNYRGSGIIEVRIWRRNREITAQPNVPNTVTTGVSYDESDGFTTTLSHTYLASGRLYVPIGFAKSHFGGFPTKTTVWLCASSGNWEASLYIQFDRDTGHIINCTIRQGVRYLFESENLEEDQTIKMHFNVYSSPPRFTFMGPL